MFMKQETELRNQKNFMLTERVIRIRRINWRI